jgi:hypothetical protein
MKLNRPYPLDAPEIGAASACRRSGEHGDDRVGTPVGGAPPSEPNRPISGIRLSSWWLNSEGDQPTFPLII